MKSTGLRTFCILVSLASCAHAPAPKSGGAEDTTAFVDVNLVALDGDRVVPHQTVIVRAGAIVAVGATGPLPTPATARVINGRGKYLMPGLADMHAHLIREEDLSLYVARGVTTVRNMWGAPVHLDWRERIARGELPGPTIITSGPIVDGDAPNHEGSLVVRSAEDAEAAIALHRRAGYDFVKVYNKLSVPAFEALIEAAKRARLPVVGHVPRAVGLARAVAAGQRSVEHSGSFLEALQTDDSPVAGRFDDHSRTQKVGYVDEAKIAPLMKLLRESETWVCPTLVVLTPNESRDALRRRLSAPETRYVGPFDRAIWRMEIEQPEDPADPRFIAFGERITTALQQEHGNLLVGTDTDNPFVIPGYSVHEELQRFVHAGLTPYETLSAATRRAAEFLGKGDFGIVAPGRRADLMLVDGDPLADVRNTARIEGVMVRGRWLGKEMLAELLEKVEASLQNADPFGGKPMPFEGSSEFSATFHVTWADAPFGAERVVVARDPRGERVLHAESFDPHEGRRRTMHLWMGPDLVGRRLALESDGPTGRGHVELTRADAQVHASGVVLPGVDAKIDAPVEETATLSASGLFAGRFMFLPAAAKLGVGQTVEVRDAELRLGSGISIPTQTWTIERIADAELPGRSRRGAMSTRRFQISTGKKKPAVLAVDPRGWPVVYETEESGARLRFERTE